MTSPAADWNRSFGRPFARVTIFDMRSDQPGDFEGTALGLSRGEVAAGSVLPQREWEVRPHEEITTAYVRAALEAVGGNMRKAARMLQVSPSTLYAKLRETPNAE